MADLTPTKQMAANAARGLRLHEAGRSGDGIRPKTIRRANIIKERKELTRDHVVEMRAWFARHKSDYKPGWDKAGEETAGFVANMLWGGPAAQKWSERKVKEMESENERNDEPNVERRNVTTDVEVRKHEDDETHVEGYAALFNSDSVLLPGGFIETLEPNAFTDVLKMETTDPVALFNHNPDYILGRRSSGTLRLYEDNKGLRYSIRMPSSAERVIEAVQRRDVIGSSFAFTVSPNDETFERGEDGIPRRRIRRVSSLLDVAVVVNPAYPSYVGRRACGPPTF